MMRRAIGGCLLAGLLTLGSMALAQSQLQVCPAAVATRSAVQATILQPNGTELRASVIPAGPVQTGCRALPLVIPEHQVLALRPIAAPVASVLVQGLSLSGPVVDG